MRKRLSMYKLLIYTYSCSVFVEWILLPIYAIFVQNIGGDILDASWAMAIFLITSGLCTVLIHRLKWSQKHKNVLLIWGRLVWVIGIALYLTVSSIATLFITQVVIALGNAMADPVFDEELEENTAKWSEVEKWWLYEWSQDIVNWLAAVIGWLAVTYFGFHTLIYLMIVAASASFVGILYYYHRKKLLTKHI